MSNSINTNIAAYYAQQNITTASAAAASNVARLSSGNAIVQASDNVAALAVGTSLGSQVNVLTAAQTNAAQGSSLLQVADGALAQIQQILQQMQSLANQAESGSLTNTDRGFLNQQFAQLTNEIDSLAQGTTFNGVNLINGSIAGGASLATSTATGSATTAPKAVIGQVLSNTGLSNGTFTLTVNGQPAITLTFGTSASDVAIGATAADTAANLAASLNNSGLAQLSNFRFSADSSGNVYAYYTGSATSLGNIPSVTASSSVADTSISSAAGSGNPLGQASFSAATVIGTITAGGVINVGDTMTIGTHTVHFDAYNTNAGTGYDAGPPANIDLGTGPNTSITAGALTNLASYLNSVAGSNGFTDLTGITFSTASSVSTDGNELVATYTGSSATPPTISTSFASAAFNALPTSGVAQAVNGATKIITVGSSSVDSGGADIDASTTLTIGSATITFGSGNDVTLSDTLSTTLTNLAAYLNTSAVQATLGAYDGVTFSTDGTSLYANNTKAGNAALTGSAPTVAVTFSNALPSGTAGTVSGSIASASTETAITLGGTTFGFNLNAGNTLTVGTQVLTFVAHSVTPNTGGVTTQIQLGTTVQGTLDNIVTYLNAHKTLMDGASNFTASDVPSTPNSTSIIIVNGSDAPITAASFTLGAGSTPTDITNLATTSSVIAPADIVGTFSGSINVGDTLVVGGTTFTVVASSATPAAHQIKIGTNLDNTLANLVTYLNTGAYNGTVVSDSTVVITHTMFAETNGELLAQNDQGTGTGTLTITYASVTNPTFTGVIGANLAAISSVGLGAGTTSAIGTPTGSLFVSSIGTEGTTATNHGNAVDLSLVANNSAFVGAFGSGGSIGDIVGTYVNTGDNTTSGVEFSVVVGNDTYTTSAITNNQLTSTTAPVTITFNGNNTGTGSPEGGSFTLTLQPHASVNNPTDAKNLADGINTALSSVSAYQNRKVLSFNNNYSATVGGVQTATLAGSSLTFNSNDFTSPLISSVTVTAPSTGSTDAKISVVINGDTYSSISGIGDSFTANQEITLENQSNPDQTLTLTLGTAGSATLSSASDASAFQTTLSNALGIGTGTSGGLTFQLGATAAANVTVTLASATSTELFGGVSQDISTKAGGASAASAVTGALNTVTAQRATTGAYESQFNFAAAALQSSVQNETAAESQLLDTNIATESTVYATNQVKLQAGISVLAQANQQTQALLKLIG